MRSNLPIRSLVLEGSIPAGPHNYAGFQRDLDRKATEHKRVLGMTLRLLVLTCVATACAIAAPSAQQTTRPFFLADDPIAVDDDRTRDASAARPIELGRYADFVLNTFSSPADRSPIRAMNVNTLDEVPDSSWFTNRLGSREMSLEEIVRGPDRITGVEQADWIIVAGKDSGRQAGFRAVRAGDPAAELFQIEFDPHRNPEMATGAEIIGTAIYHAIGYNVVETYLIDFDPARVAIAPDATIAEGGSTRRFTRGDLQAILDRAARKADGRYRASASRFAEGRYLGPFRYYGTRPDDPNDIYPHEHRRELRGNRVFAAWLNHDDSRAGNSLDMLVGTDGARYVKHYMFDFGSMLGSGTNEEDHPWVGHEYLIERGPAVRTLFSFGLWRRPFMRVAAPSDMPAAGNFTADRFVPAAWRPHYPNAAFDNLQPEDAFWAARIVAAFTPEAIAAIVAKAQFSDPRVVDHVTGTLIRRRELVLRTWLTAVAPIVNGRIEGGSLRFDDAAAASGITQHAGGHALAWFAFDNAHGRRRYVHEATVGAADRVPASLANAEYIGVDISVPRRLDARASGPARLYFRRTGDGWTAIAIERRADPGGEIYASR
jgi:hypothetical protein